MMDVEGVKDLDKDQTSGVADIYSEGLKRIKEEI